MGLQQYEGLAEIDTTTYDWQCKVRAQTVWNGMNKEMYQSWGMNIIFLDDSVCNLYVHFN